jgi:hypothetical protein
MLSSTDQIQWQEFEEKFRQAPPKCYKVKMQSSTHLPHKDSFHDNNIVDRFIDKHIERQSTSQVEDQMDNDKFEDVDHIRIACHKIKWNVLNNNSNVLILTVELDSNKPICSLSNADPRMDYSHLCQYGQ